MLTRRHFIQRTGAALTGSALLSALSRAGYAQTPPADYKALVCLFLNGGNDGNNLLIPLDDEGYAQYEAVRGSSSGINISQESWLPIMSASQGGRNFGLHPSLKGLKGLYDSGRAGLLCNVGTLQQPLTRVQYRAGQGRPPNLFSHLDQVLQWQAGSGGSVARPSGWGGRLADANGSRFNGETSFPMLASLSGVNLFTTGLAAGVIAPGSSSLRGFGTSAASKSRYEALRKIESLDDGRSALIQAKNRITGAAIDNLSVLNSALDSLPALSTVFPTSSLGQQLQTVARMIALRDVLGLRRQIFYCSLGGFDTHANQLSTQASLLATLDAALSAFHAATVELDVEQAVTSFTLSDFGRTFKPSAGGGSDHGWGSHHLLVGGAVNGGDLYGRYPSLIPGGDDDADSEGRWIPTTSVDEYGAQLARWFGAGDLSALFPNIGNFDASRTDLGFMAS